MRVAIVAGEASGDLLGADLLTALRQRMPQLTAEGVTGPALRAAGCGSLEDMQSLAVMGITEVMGELPRLLALRKRLLEHWRADPPDVFIGIDAPDFNLGLERRLKRHGVRTVHYVSPTVWAWRPGRVKTIARAADLLLCLFPFEPEYFRETGPKAIYVGHPFAAQMAAVPGRADCRLALGIHPEAEVLAVLPGSRMGEIRALGPLLIEAMTELKRRRPALEFAVPAANERVGAAFGDLLQGRELAQDVKLVSGRMREVVRSADAALVTSGTATLETMLLGTPFLVAYRASPVTEWLLRGLGLLKIQHVALPNILAGRAVAPELLQGDAEPASLAGTAYQLLVRSHLAREQREVFGPLAAQLDQPSGEIAARAVLDLCAAG